RPALGPKPERSEIDHGAVRFRRAGRAAIVAAFEAAQSCHPPDCVIMLKLENLYKVFYPGTPNEVRALRGVSLGLEPGSFLIIIGTNGSGKSTLLNAVAGTFIVDIGRI